MESSGSLLGLIVDLHPVWWGKLVEPDKSALDLSMASLAAFCNAFAFSNPQNRLFVISAGAEVEKPILYHGEESIVNCGEFIAEKLKGTLIEAMNKSSCLESMESRLAGPLASAFCYIKRKSKTGTYSQGRRVLIVKVSDDATRQHLSLMTLFFAAHKQNVILDGCSLAMDSPILQQAADITGGTYRKVLLPHEFAQVLMTTFLPDPATRQRLTSPLMKDVDYSPSCFCHHKMVTIGWVCSVCLSVFCQFTPICPTCHSAFNFLPSNIIKGVKRKKNSKGEVSADGNS